MTSTEISRSLVPVSVRPPPSSFMHNRPSHMQSPPGCESAQWYSIAEASPALVRLCDEQGAALYFNRRWLEFTGVDSSRQLGRDWLALVHEEDADAATVGGAQAGVFRLAEAAARYKSVIETSMAMNYLRRTADALELLVRRHWPQSIARGVSPPKCSAYRS